MISKDLLGKYTWSGKSINGTQENKHCFQSMNMIQSVLWCAMVKVNPTYSVQEFENDFKNNLSKCASQNKTSTNEEAKLQNKTSSEETEAENKNLI